MTTVVLAFLVMVALLAAMAIGVILGRKPISGSCGGMKALGLDVECEICGGNPELCDSQPMRCRICGLATSREPAATS